jgi:hypothetical protein
MDLRTLLPALRLLSVEEMLRKMADFYSQNPDEIQAPVAELLLTNGQRVMGTPIKAEQVAGEWQLLLFEPRGGPQNVDAARLLPLRSVVSVSLQNLFRDSRFVTTPGIWNQDTTDAPSRLSLERRKDGLIPLLESVGGSGKSMLLEWNGQHENPGARVAADQVLTALEVTLKNFAKDDLAKSALVQVSNWQLVFEPEASLDIQKKTGGLEIRFGLKLDSKDLNSTLQKKIEKNL